ncbi:MAG: YaeQ family protein [Gammaproteobacteria bacterium]|nr:YaeQ family protein [Gammaproteobacteria bacterium]
MASRATIYKVDLQIADMDRNYYQNHALTVAQHPSETEERMMLRVLAFAWCADAALAFGRGLSTEDEPDLWRKDLTGAVEHWIDVGQPEERDIRRACGRAKQVTLFCYGGRGVDFWWTQIRPQLERLRNLTVLNVPTIATQALARLAKRTMQLQFTIQDGQAWVTDGAEAVSIEPLVLFAPEMAAR